MKIKECKEKNDSKSKNIDQSLSVHWKTENNITSRLNSYFSDFQSHFVIRQDKKSLQVKESMFESQQSNSMKLIDSYFSDFLQYLAS